MKDSVVDFSGDSSKIHSKGVDPSVEMKDLGALKSGGGVFVSSNLIKRASILTLNVGESKNLSQIPSPSPVLTKAVGFAPSAVSIGTT